MMKESNRGLLYKYCEEYLKTLMVRQELVFLDPHLECPIAKEKLDNQLKVLEKGMLETLQEE